MKRRFKIKIYKDALSDILDATNWYNEQLEGLGNRFQKQVKSQIDTLKIKAEYYGIRYSNVRFVVCVFINFLFLLTLLLMKKNC